LSINGRSDPDGGWRSGRKASSLVTRPVILPRNDLTINCGRNLPKKISNYPHENSKYEIAVRSSCWWVECLESLRVLDKYLPSGAFPYRVVPHDVCEDVGDGVDTRGFFRAILKHDAYAWASLKGYRQRAASSGEDRESGGRPRKILLVSQLFDSPARKRTSSLSGERGPLNCFMVDEQLPSEAILVICLYVPEEPTLEYWIALTD
jgi:hypothetical protein